MKRSLSLLLSALLLLPVLAAPAWAVPARRSATATSGKAAVPTHVVRKGESLYTIARKNNMTVDELKRLNRLQGNNLKPGQRLVLGRPKATASAVAGIAPKQETAPAEVSSASPADPAEVAAVATHRVKKGESLYTIARKHGMTVDELKRLNRLQGSALKPGQKLALGPSSATTKNGAPPDKSVATRTHLVKKGDSLSRIARKAGISVAELKRLNGLRGSALKPGQRLVLSRPAASSAPPPEIARTPDAGELLRQEAAAATPAEAELLSTSLLPESSQPDMLEEAAFAYLSTPYRFGGNSRKGIDCSGFVQQVFRDLEIELPRSAREQYRVGSKVAREELQSGDLLFFRTYAKYPSHVGIYLGDGKMIHASPRSRRVVVTDIDSPYFRRRYIGAKRIALLGTALNLEALASGVEEAGEEEMTDAPPERPEAAAEPAGDSTAALPAADN